MNSSIHSFEIPSGSAKTFENSAPFVIWKIGDLFDSVDLIGFPYYQMEKISKKLEGRARGERTNSSSPKIQ